MGSTMKQDVHPPYHPKATVTCACGATFTIGATKPEIRVEICSKCHPFYTGRQELIDTAGRVERFKARAAKATAGAGTRSKRTPKVRKSKNKKP